MGNFAVWISVALGGYYLYKKVKEGVLRLAEEFRQNQEEALHRANEMAAPTPFPTYAPEAELLEVEEARGYTPIDNHRKVVEGGKTMVEFLDHLDDESGQEATLTATTSSYSARELRHRLLDGVVMKEILERKYF